MTHRKTHTALIGLAGLGLLAAQASPSHAGAFGLGEVSASATGMANAGAASGSGGVASLYWNPATVTMAPGANAQLTASFLGLSSRITPMDGTSRLLGREGSGELGLAALVPSGAFSYQITDRLWLGLASVVPYGATTKPEHDWAGQIYSRTSRVRSYGFNPVIGYKVNEWLSIGAGPNIEVFQVRLNKAVSFLPGAATGSVRADDVAVGFSAGATITPAAGTTLGIGYRSSVGHDLRGRLDTGRAVVPVRARLNTPDQLTLGLTQALAPDLRLNLGYEWTNWSRLGTIQYIGPQGLPVASLPLGYRDGHLFSIGAEYDVDRAWTVRGGVGYEISPVTQAVRSTAIPDADRFHLSAGLSYRLADRISLDLAYKHVFVADAKVRIAAGSHQLVTASLPGLGATPLPFAGDVRSSADVVSVTLNYRLD